MFKRVLLCYDGSAAGRRALRRGAELAILVNARVYVLAVVPSELDPAVIAGAAGHVCLVDSQKHGFAALLDESIRWLKGRGVDAEGFLTTGPTIDRIIAYSKKLTVDLIVLGHYPQPSGGFWWSGSQRVSLAEKANCCVFVAVDGPGDAPAA